jgi:tetratricopeptide (TPR) repeat protein
MTLALRMAPAEAEQTLGKAAAIQERLVADHPDLPNPRYDLAKCLHITAGVKRSTGRAAEAEADLRRSLTLLHELDARYPSVGYFRGRLVGALVDLGDVIRDGRPKEAEAAYREAILLFEPVPDRTKPVPRARVVNGAWEGLADVVLNQGDHTAAARAAEDWLRAAPNWEAQPRAAAILVRAAAAAAKDSKLPEAVRRELAGANGARADELLSAFVKRRPGNASEHNNLAWRFVTGPDVRFHDPAQALRLANWAVERAPGQATYWNTLGVAEYRMGHWKAAVAALKKSIELRKEGDSFDWFFLAMAHWQLREKDTAREWYDRAAEWMEKNQPTNEELIRFRAEAAGLLGIEKKKD